MRHGAWILCALGLGLVPVACGNDSSGGPPSSGGAGGGQSGGAGGSGGSLPDCSSIEEKTIADLDTLELGLLCDCVAEFFGGYGKEIQCDGGFVVASKPSQQECIEGLKVNQSQCEVLVSDALKCMDAFSKCFIASLECASLAACGV